MTSPSSSVSVGVGPPRSITPPRPLWWADQRQAVGYLLLGIGVWLFVTLWVLDYPQTPQSQDAHLNEIMVGIVVFLNGMARLVRNPSRVSDGVVALAGAWLLVAPFVVGYTTNAEAGDAAVADVATGGALILLALYSAFALRISQRLFQRQSRRA
ncbi:SPW repeat protein [Streptacidiphilus sp. MAP12-20]|uniref:SPW repeat domain-containing protein n=1 Tax=Streptacidiphilus sp. MAP12-20 TaxID=3156299 RepID=UPI00351474E1